MIETSKITQLPLESIRTDGGTQPRAALDQNVIQEYAQDMLLGATFPPVIVFYDGSDYWLADGFHRYHGAKQICRETIDAEIRQGTRRDAVLYSVGTNASHGLRRTNEDKYRSVQTMLRDEEWGKWSDNQIAKQCGVSQPFVSKLRTELSYNDYKIENSPRVVERNGTIYTMNTTNIGQQQNLTPQEFVREVFPGLQWQRDNQTLGLDEFADPLTDEEPDEEIPPTDYTPITSIHPLERPLYESFVQAMMPKSDIPESWKLPPEMRTPPVEDNPFDIKEKRDAHVMRVMGSSDSPEWYTPSDIIDRVCKMFGEVDTDPCSNSHETPAVPASTLYTKEDDGLSQIWRGRTYLNPPYGSEISLWTDKLVAEYKRGNVEEGLALLPARIDTVWFSPLYEYLMCNVKGRIQFANSPYHAPFPCIIVYLGTRLNDFVEVFKDLGPIMRRIA